VSYPGLHLLEPETLNHAPFCLVDVRDQKQYFFVVKDKVHAAEDAVQGLTRQRSQSRLALILENLPRDRDDVQAIVVTITEEKNGMFYARYELRVLLRPMSESDRRMIDAFLSPSQVSFSNVQNTDELQKWCVG
jgi:hypothetical protein